MKKNDWYWIIGIIVLFSILFKGCESEPAVEPEAVEPEPMAAVEPVDSGIIEDCNDYCVDNGFNDGFEANLGCLGGTVLESCCCVTWD